MNASLPPPRLLLIAPHDSYRVAPYLKAAASLDIAVTIASASKNSLTSIISDGLFIDFTDPGAALRTILAASAKTAFAAVLGSDDRSVALAAQVAAALGLPHNPPAAAQYSRRKDLARACLAAAGVAVPAHQRIELDQPLAPQLEQLDYPCVLKPLALSGSRGVIRVDDVDAARAALTRIQAILREVEEPAEAGAVLAEAYIDGREVAYEGLLDAGELQPLALFDKPEPLEGPYFEETYYITPSRELQDIQGAVHDSVAAACRAYGLQQGPVHAELRIDAQGQVWVMEVASRTIGGECARLVELATGQSLERLVIAQLLGIELPRPAFGGAAGVLMIPIPRGGILRRVEGTLEAQRVAGIRELVLSVREGHELVPLPEGASYLGFIYAVADTPGQVEAALREAHAKLRVVTAPLFRLAARPA